MIDGEAGIAVDHAVAIGVLIHAGRLDFKVIGAGLARNIHREVLEVVPVDMALTIAEVGQLDVLDHIAVELEQQVVVGIRLVGVDGVAVIVNNILGRDPDRQLGVNPGADIDVLTDVDIARRSRSIQPLLFPGGKAGDKTEALMLDLHR